MKKNNLDFDTLINETIQYSEQKIRDFTKGIFSNISDEKLKTLETLPIFSSETSDTLISCNLSTKSSEKISDSLYAYFDDLLYDSHKNESILGAYVRTSDLLNDLFTEEEQKEYLKLIQEGKQQPLPPSFIIYNHEEMASQLSDLIEANDELDTPKSPLELSMIFLEHMSPVFTHERCHFLAERITSSGKQVNGCEINLDELNINQNLNYLANVNSLLAFNTWKNNNEVFIDTISMMIHNYQPGNTIEDSLSKVIDSRNELGEYTTLNDTATLTLMILFPKELTEWGILDSNSCTKNNLVLDKYQELFGSTLQELSLSTIQNAVTTYSANNTNKLSLKQHAMLGQLGVTDYKEITPLDLESFAYSAETLKDIASNQYFNSLSDISQIINKGLPDANKDYDNLEH